MKNITAFLTLAFILLIGSQVAGEYANACCSLRHAQFTATKGYAGEALRKGQVVHVLAYQNDVLNLAVRRAGRRLGSDAQQDSTDEGVGDGNAMLLPIPAKPGSMTRFNVVNSSTCPHVLSDMANALAPPRARAMHFSQKMAPGGAPAIQVFDTDIYTVVLARNAKDIPAALSMVPAEKRPAINSAIFNAYSRWYPKWTFALCCFNTTKKTSARPLIWWYQPMHPDELFFPAIDAHNGNPPDLSAQVAVDHALAVGSRLVKFEDGASASNQPSEQWKMVNYTDNSIAPDVQELLPQKIMGEIYHGLLPQGDFVFKTRDVRSGKYVMTRALPPGARKS